MLESRGALQRRRPEATGEEERETNWITKAAPTAPAAGERAFLFDKDLSRCLGEVEREEWELVLSCHGGDVCEAARECGVDGVDLGAKALWGRSADEALGTYRRWQKRRKP